MKNYLGRLGINRKASESTLRGAIEQAISDTVNIESLKNADSVLSDKATRTYYERTHLQYEAICASLACLNAPQAQDTHRWTERLVEFETEKDETLN